MADFPSEKRIEFLTVMSHQLINSIRNEALSWVQAIGQTMVVHDLPRATSLHARIDIFLKTLHQVNFVVAITKHTSYNDQAPYNALTK